MKFKVFQQFISHQKNSKQNPRKYEGGREVEDFIKYLAKESTEPLNGYDRNGSKKKAKKTTDDEL